jgi:hypothetical protein
MASPLQIAANRRNAQRSTGPRTVEGKQRSSMNPLKHGLSARTIVLSHEDEIGYHEVRGSLYTQYQPATPQECMLVDQLASAWWRTIRARQYETDLMNMQVENVKRRNARKKKVHNQESDRKALVVALTVEPHDDFKTFFRYDATIERQFYRALNQLERIQKERRSAAKSTEIGFVSQSESGPVYQAASHAAAPHFMHTPTEPRAQGADPRTATQPQPTISKIASTSVGLVFK